MGGVDEAVMVDDDDDDDDKGEKKKKRIGFKITISVPTMGGGWIAMDVEGGESMAQLKAMIMIEDLAALMVGGMEMQIHRGS